MRVHVCTCACVHVHLYTCVHKCDVNNFVHAGNVGNVLLKNVVFGTFGVSEFKSVAAFCVAQQHEQCALFWSIGIVYVGDVA